MGSVASRVMPDQGMAGMRPLLEDRYRASLPETAAWSPAIDGMVRHRSVRSYADTALPPGTLEALVASAQSAATSSNLQAWSVIAVTDADRKARLSALAGSQKHIRQAPLFLIWLADLSRHASIGEQAGQPMECLPYMEMFLLAVVDAALAAQNAVVAAESLGLGTVYIGALRNKPAEVAAELGLPAGVFAVFGLCVGYEAGDPAAVKPRLPQSVVLHHETYGESAPAEGIAAQDASLRDFQQEQGMAAQGWSQLVLGRLGAVQSLHGRDRLADIVRELGFGLR